jgi:nicotinate-nucleotide pyrophosphorylase
MALIANPLSAIDIISTSAIHQSTKHVDFSLKIEPLSQVKTDDVPQ